MLTYILSNDISTLYTRISAGMSTISPNIGDIRLIRTRPFFWGADMDLMLVI